MKYFNSYLYALWVSWAGWISDWWASGSPPRWNWLLLPMLHKDCNTMRLIPDTKSCAVFWSENGERSILFEYTSWLLPNIKQLNDRSFCIILCQYSFLYFIWDCTYCYLRCRTALVHRIRVPTAHVVFEVPTVQFGWRVNMVHAQWAVKVKKRNKFVWRTCN